MKKFGWIICLAMMTPMMLSAAEHGEHSGGPHPEWIYIIFQCINLAILLVLLFRFTRRPLQDFLVRRQDSIKDALEKAESAKLEAEKKKQEYERRLAGLEDEIAAFREEVEQRGREEADGIVASAKVTAVRIEQDTKRLLDDELARARHQLRVETVNLAIALAENILSKQTDESDQHRLAEEYLKRVVQSTEIH